MTRIIEVINTMEHKVTNRREAARICMEKGQIGKNQMVYPSETDAHRSGILMLDSSELLLSTLLLTSNNRRGDDEGSWTFGFESVRSHRDA